MALMLKLLVLSLHVLLTLAGRKIPVSEDCLLCDYVYSDDEVPVTVIGIENYNLPGLPVTTFLFNVTSSIQYLNASFVQNPDWWHVLVVHVPQEWQDFEKALLMITNLEMHEYPDASNPGLLYTARLAANQGTVTAAIFHVPNAPIVWLHKGNPSSEDSDISIGTSIFLSMQQQEPLIHLYAAMTKVTIKAMNAVQIVQPSVKEFVLMGTSKRGVICWLAGAIDDRVVAIIPATSLYAVNSNAVMHQLHRNLGGVPFFFAFLLQQGVLAQLDSAPSNATERVSDPIFFVDYLKMPKLIIAASSDEFSLVDNTYNSFSQFQGESKLWILENRGHYVEIFPGYDQVLDGIEAFYASIIRDFPRPHISWTRVYRKKRKFGQIVVSICGAEPKYVTTYYAQSVASDRRDWRTTEWCLQDGCPTMKLCSNCYDLPIRFTGVQWVEDQSKIKYYRHTQYSYSAKYQVPKEGFLAFYIKMVFDGPDGNDMTYTTEVQVLPEIYPYPDCSYFTCGDANVALV